MRISHSEADSLLESQNIEPPKKWSSYTISDKLDYIATRILAEDREGKTSKQEILEEGYHSIAQEKRRLSRLVFFGNRIPDGQFDGDEQNTDYIDNFFRRGVFNRTHVNNDLHTGE